MTPRCFSTLAFLLSAGTLAVAQAAPAHPTATTLEQRFAAWKADRAPSWRLAPDEETGSAQMIYGGKQALGVAPRDEAEAAGLALQALALTQSLHGLDASTLELQRALFLPLGQVGSGDKWTVRFRQTVSGVPVVGGFANVLLNTQGDLLSVQSTGLPNLGRFDVTPALQAGAGVARAVETFRERFGVAPTLVGSPELVVAQITRNESRVGRLAWQVDVQWAVEGTHPEGETYWIDARDGSLLTSEKSVLDFDVTGTVTSRATPGLAPDSATNLPTAQTMEFARVQAGATTVYADANGNFVFPGVNTPLSCTFTYVGTFNNVTNSAGAPYSLTQTVPANSPTTVVLNPTGTAQVTAQANAFRCVMNERDFVRTTNPSDATADIVFLSHCNLSQTCNAYFDGTSINFFLAGGGCPNSAYSTVVNHEQGHWLNVLYGTGNGSDGMGEGNADVWAEYVNDDPVIAQDFFGIGQPIRTGLNTSPFCGDTHPSCHGEVHADGEPWMGAAWKVRARLQTTNGHAAGSLIANNIFLGWMNGYDQTTIRSIIETQWLTLDDNDGNLNNGTPHFGDIDGGFRDQQFPGVTLAPISISNLSQVADTTDTLGPYVVGVDALANFAPPLTAVVLSYQNGNGAFVNVPMSPTGGNHYIATIPGQPVLSIVRYYVTATDSAALSINMPNSAPEHILAFDVGSLHTVRIDHFDGPSNDGWTSASFNDTSNHENDWQRGVPLGKTGSTAGVIWQDPTNSFSGSYCFANDLGSGGGDGAYSASVHSYLRSPVINCSGAVNTRLRFASWLGIEGNASDQARVVVNGNVLYLNPSTTRSDQSWAAQEYDISSIADHNPSVTIEFQIQSNGTNQYGGWTVDEVSVFYVTAPCPAPSTYCISTPNSTNAAAIMAFSGSGNVSLNNLTLIAYNCPFNTTGLFFYGAQQTQVAFGNGFRCVGGSVFRLPIQQTDGFGEADRSVDLNNMPGGAITSGQHFNFQFWYRNPAAGGAGFNLTDGLSVTFCP